LLVQLPAGRPTDHELSATLAELRRTKLGTTVRYRAGDNVPTIVLLGAGNNLRYSGSACPVPAAGLCAGTGGSTVHAAAADSE